MPEVLEKNKSVLLKWKQINWQWNSSVNVDACSDIAKIALLIMCIHSVSHTCVYTVLVQNEAMSHYYNLLICFIQNEAFYNIIDTHYSWCPKWGFESLLQLVNIHKVFCIFIWPVTSSYWLGCNLLIFIRLFCMMSKMRLWLTYTMQTQFFIFFTMQKKILTQWKQIFLAKYLHNGNKNIYTM